jgi:hypothetical protein
VERDLIAADSVPVLERPEEDAPLVTELIAGERLAVMERRGGWLRVVVPGHATGLDPRGYPGRARPGGLVDAPGADEVFVGPEDLVEDPGMLEAGGIPAPVSYRNLAEGMITVSDNAATNLLIRRAVAGGGEHRLSLRHGGARAGDPGRIYAHGWIQEPRPRALAGPAACLEDSGSVPARCPLRPQKPASPKARRTAPGSFSCRAGASRRPCWSRGTWDTRRRPCRRRCGPSAGSTPARIGG